MSHVVVDPVVNAGRSQGCGARMHSQLRACKYVDGAGACTHFQVATDRAATSFEDDCTMPVTSMHDPSVLDMYSSSGAGSSCTADMSGYCMQAILDI